MTLTSATFPPMPVKEELGSGRKNNGSLAEQGTPDSGYAENGPYHCEDCIHKTAPDDPFCIHPKVVRDKKLKKKLVQIDRRPAVRIDLEHGCCRYVNQPLEEAEEDE